MAASIKPGVTDRPEPLERQFIAVNPAIFWTTDPDGRLRFVDEASAHRLGVPAQFDTADGYLELIHPTDLATVATETQRAFAEQRMFDVECRGRLGDRYRWVRLRGQFDRGCRRWFGTVEDIDARHEAEAALKVANERLALALQGNAAWAWDFDIRAGRFWFSDAWQDVLGYGTGDLGFDLSDFERLVHPDDQQAVDRLFRAHLAGHIPMIEADYRVRHGDGRWVWVQDRGRVIERDGEGRPVRAVGTRTDITARKAVEAQAQANEAYLKTLLDNITEGVVAVSPDGQRGFYNKAYARMFLNGTMPSDDWGDLSQLFGLFDVFDSDGRRIPDAERPIRRILAGETIEELEVGAVVRPTGQSYRLIYNGQPVRDADGRIELAVLSIRDVTDRVAAQDALRASEERLRLATDGAGMGAWDYDLIAASGVWSASACRLLGYPVETHRIWSMGDWQSRVHSADVERVLANAAASRQAKQSYVIDFRIVRADDGEVRWVQSFGTYIHGAAGTAVRHVGVFFDITDRKLAETGLRESEARLEAIIENLEEGVVAYSPDEPGGGFANSAFRRMVVPHDPEWRIFRDVGEGVRAFDLIDPDGSPLSPEQRPMPRLLRGERIDHLAARVRFRDGRELNVVCRGVPILDADGRVKLAILTVRDVTREHEAEASLAKLQQELIHVSRVSAMGTMAGSLAHELNQPLAAIANYAAAAKMRLGDPQSPIDQTVHALKNVADEALRAGQIVNRLRRFITKGEVDRQPASLAGIVREAIAIAHSDASAQGTHVKLKLDPDADHVVADRIQLQQVIFNLVRNAVEAMEDGPGSELTIASRPAGDMIELLIADRGPGLPAEVKAHLFEPFITTKESGMGIGLPICQSIMRAHGGDIRAEPRPRGGTVFILTLPGAKAPLTA